MSEYRYQNRIEGYKHENNLQSAYVSAKEGLTGKDSQQILSDIFRIALRYHKNESQKIDDPKDGLLIGVGQYLYKCLNKEFYDKQRGNGILNDPKNTEQLRKLLTHNIQQQFTQQVQQSIKDIIQSELSKISAAASKKSTSASFDSSTLTPAERIEIQNILDSDIFAEEFSEIYERMFTAVSQTLRAFQLSFNGRDDLVKQISKVMLQLDDKYEKDIDQIYDKYRNNKTDKAEVTQLIQRFKDAISKDTEEYLQKQNDKNNVRGMSLRDAFIKTLRNNADFSKRNQNFVAKVLASRVKESVKNVKKAFKRASITLYKVFHPIRTLKKWFRWWRLANLLGKAVKNSFRLLQGVVNIGFKIGVVAVKSAIGLTKGVFNFTRNVLRFSVNFVKGTIRGITSRLSGLFSFIKNNTFLKRLYRFLRTDVGAIFLGTLAAFVKVFVFDTLVEKILSVFPSLKYPVIQDTEALESILNDISELAIDSNFAGIADIVKIWQNTMSIVIQMINFGDEFFNKITSDKSIQKIKDTLERIITFADMAFNVAKFAATYRFAVLGVKFGKFMKHPLLAIGGVLVGFILDTIVNKKVTKAWKNDKDDENKTKGTNVFLQLGMPSVQSSSYTDRQSTFERIQNMYGELPTEEAERKRKQLSDRYFGLLDDMDINEAENTELGETLDKFKEEDAVRKIPPHVFESWFNRISQMVINGKKMNVIGNKAEFDSIRDSDVLKQNLGKLNYLKMMMMTREDYIENLKTSMYNAGVEGKDIDGLLETVEQQNLRELMGKQTFNASNIKRKDFQIKSNRTSRNAPTLTITRDGNKITGTRMSGGEMSMMSGKMQRMASRIIPMFGMQGGEEGRKAMAILQRNIDALRSDSTRSDGVGQSSREKINELMGSDDVEKNMKNMLEYFRQLIKDEEKKTGYDFKMDRINDDQLIIMHRNELKDEINKYIGEYVDANDGKRITRSKIRGEWYTEVIDDYENGNQTINTTPI